MPAGPRADLMRVYAFARFVDDLGDGPYGTPGTDRVELLTAVADDVRRLPTADAHLPVISALTGLVAQDRVRLPELLDLIEANIVDQHTSAYATFVDLLEYCRLSAAPVGRMVLGIAGASTPERQAASDEVCAGLQVLEHCQDVGEDARAGRVYLPATELAAAGVEPTELTSAVTGPRLRGVIAHQVQRSHELLAAGDALVAGLRGWARIAVAGFVAGGRATEHALVNAEYAVLESLIRPSKPRTAALAVRLAAGVPS